MSGLCEGLERLAGRFQGDEIRLRASHRQLREQAIHPNACMLYSDAQYRDRAAWNALDSRFSQVPEPFDDDLSLDWTPVWSLTERMFKYLPSELLYYSYPTSGEARYCLADSSGVAAGPTLEAAVVSGFLELVERDAVSLWWYNRLKRPPVDLDSFDEPYVHELRRHFLRQGREVWALDLTNDLEIPAFVVVSRLTGATPERIMFGFAAHFDPRRALLSALSEMTQVALSSTGLEDSQPHPIDDPTHRTWWQTASVDNQPYIKPTEQPARSCADFDLGWRDNAREDLERCEQLVTKLGLELLVLEQTRPDIGLPVAKVIVPGSDSTTPGSVPGRLYEAPVRLGWLDQPLHEDQLNPIPMFV